MGNILTSKIEKSLKYNTLDYKWAVRKYLGEHPDEKSELMDFLSQIANSSFEYYSQHKNVLDSDKSLKAIMSVCTDPELIYNINASDAELEFLSQLFNQMVRSSRGLHRCYDCGTTARTMFFLLIEANRGKYYISPLEQMRITKQYTPDFDTPLLTIRNFQRDVLHMKSDTVFICSLGIDGFGHVWIIEKRFMPIPGSNKMAPRYHHYQSCFKSHLLIDFIEDMDYGKNLHQSVDINEFCDNFSTIMAVRGPWEEEHYKLYAKLFAYLPTKTVDAPKSSFSYSYVIY